MIRAEGALELLRRIAGEYSPAALASSLGAEDMVLTDLIARHRLPIGIFTLDTGRLHGDTLVLIPQVERRYGVRVEIVRPDAQALARYVAAHGKDAFYRSAALRARCCEIRKVEPLARALSGKRAWVTGLRREHSSGRAKVAVEEFDARHGIAKFNPLAHWSEKDVWAYLRAHAVPYNPLHDQGYRSIGCAPCTRPVLPTEDPRSGRWWWERRGERECGIHLHEARA
jgi:phosphoadenosine phosphosulfate reductase